ncbi:MAG: SPOR domain-containing protein [Saprospiraceae bacterium]|nr:SPOR domain-containing protein [Saprospiraceae bacterium]
MNYSLSLVGRILAIGFCTASNLEAQTNLQESLARADKQFDLYAYNLALNSYDQILKEQPNNTHALARIGDCHFQLNRPQEALSWYDRAVVLGNVTPEILLRYGKALMYTGDYYGAKKWFLQYATSNPAVGQHFSQMCDFALQAARKDGIFSALNEPLSTPASDYAPTFYGDKIVLSSARTDIKRKTTAKTSSDWTGSAYNQLYVTQRGSGDVAYLQNPAFLHDDLQNDYNEGPVSFSADGRRVAFCRNNFIDGTRQIAEKGVNLSLHIADVVDGKWVNERAFPYNGSDFSTGYPCFSQDGNSLYFASTQEGGFGGWDIFVSTWNGNAWSVPRNLGAPLNTAGNEVTPFFDGENLYFSSDWHNGVGGMDVFRAEMDGNNISGITHLGTGINSSRDDYGFVFDPKTNTGYLTSNRPEGRGNEDIWQVRKKVDEFVILVTDPQKTPLAGADIDFSACNAGFKQTDAGGRYSFAVAAGKVDCRVTVRKEGYRPLVLPIQSSGEKNLTAVLMPEYGTTPPQTTPAQPDVTAPQTYSTTGTVPVQSGKIEKYTIYVSDDQGRALPAAALNLTTCGLGTLYTDVAGKGSFYFPVGTTCNMIVQKDGLEDVVIPIHSQTSREISITMSADKRTKFSGLVYDNNTRQVAHAVIITAKSRQSGHESLASTNTTGRYSLWLRPYQTYDITYTRDGYLNFVNAVQTERYSPIELELAPVGIQPMAATPATYSTTPASGGMISLAELEKTPAPTTSKVDGYAIQLSADKENYTDVELRKYDTYAERGNIYTVKEGQYYKLRLGVYPTKEKAEAALSKLVPTPKDAFVVRENQATQNMLVDETATKGVETAPAMYTTPSSSNLRFAVQVASFPTGKPIPLADYSNLSSLGTTYVQQENERARVRVGAWESHEKAEAVRAEAMRLGYKDALIVTEKVENAPVESATPTIPAPKSVFTPISTTPVQYSTTGGATPTPAPAATAKFHVRICALDEPYSFDQKKVEGLGGAIERWPIGDTQKIAIMLTGFTTPDQAIYATDKIRARGFPDAYIIAEENGRMSKYRY